MLANVLPIAIAVTWVLVIVICFFPRKK